MHIVPKFVVCPSKPFPPLAKMIKQVIDKTRILTVTNAHADATDALFSGSGFQISAQGQQHVARQALVNLIVTF